MPSSFAERLRDLKTRDFLRTSDLAEAIGVSPERMLLLESGKSLPNYEELRALSDYFHLSADYFLCLDGRYYLYASDGLSAEMRDILYFLIPAAEEYFRAQKRVSPAPRICD